MARYRSRVSARLLIALSLLALLGLPQTLLAAENGDGLRRALAAQERVNEQVLGKAGVVGTGVGVDRAGKAVIQVFAVHGNVTGIPRSANGVGVQRVVTGLITARSCPNDNPTTKCERPVPIGVSVGHPSITAGTIGARVTNSAGDVFALSNNHVLANSNEASIGDPALQPGPYDGGNLSDSIGTLHDFEPIRFGSGTINTMDAAIALSTTANLGTATLSYGYGTPGTAAVDPSINMSVQKCGRTTNCTTGTVAQVNVTVDVCYIPRGRFFCASNGVARFVDQFSVTPGTFSAGGDSGSLIVTNDDQKRPVGLLFAGSATHTFANPIGPVLQRFGVDIDDRVAEPPGDDPPGDDPPDDPDVNAPTGLSVSVRPQGAPKMDLAWSGGGATVDVYRQSPNSSFQLIATTSNSGSYRDNLSRHAPSGTYTYRVCNSGTQDCDEATGTL